MRILGYRGEERFAVSAARARHAGSLVLDVLPRVYAQRRARRSAGHVGIVLAGAAGWVAIVPHPAIDAWAAQYPFASVETYGGVLPAWRPLVLYVLLATCVGVWATFRQRAERHERERLLRLRASRLATAAYVEALREGVEGAAGAEASSAGPPLALAALLGPLLVHALLVPVFGAAAFDAWIVAVGRAAWIGQLVLVAFALAHARRWPSLGTKELDRDGSWKGSFLVAVTSVLATVAVSASLGHAPAAVFLAAIAAALMGAVCTGLAVWPLAHGVSRGWILRERGQLEGLRQALDDVGADVRVADLTRTSLVDEEPVEVEAEAHEKQRRAVA